LQYVADRKFQTQRSQGARGETRGFERVRVQYFSNWGIFSMSLMRRLYNLHHETIASQTATLYVFAPIPCAE
jgi:hypothetical protein